MRPFLYGFYRYVLAGGFLDGKEAFKYHFLHAVWYRFLIDVKYLELKKRPSRESKRDSAIPTTTVVLARRDDAE
jgi:hypothetical protein